MNELVGDRNVRIAVISVLGILSLFLLAKTVVTAEEWGRPTTPATNTITVNGEGQASVAPDVSYITFTAAGTADTSAKAQDVVTSITSAILPAIKDLGVADSDVSTLSYNISPRYAHGSCGGGYYCPPDTSKVIAYDASQTVQIKVHNLDTVGDVLKVLATNGVQVSGPSLGLDNPNEGNDAARAAAIANAKAEAQKLAAQLGVHLGKVVSFSDNGGYQTYAPMADGMDSKAEGMPPQIPTGENQYSSSVYITYEIW